MWCWCCVLTPHQPDLVAETNCTIVSKSSDHIITIPFKNEGLCVRAL